MDSPELLPIRIYTFSIKIQKIIHVIEDETSQFQINVKNFILFTFS